MMSIIKCKFCGGESESQYHAYCGFFNVYNFGGDDEDKVAIEAHSNSPEYKASQMYHDVTIKGITDISLMSYEYGWDEKSSEYKLLNTTTQKLADATQCDGKVYWVPDKEFCQPPEDDIHPQTLEISYKFNGTEYKAKCGITPVRSNDFYHIGVEVTKDFKLYIYLGSEKDVSKQAKSDFVALKVA